MVFDLSTVVWILLAALAVWYVQQSIRLKEATHRAVENYCREQDVQLLDGTIVLRRVRPLHSGYGVCLKRQFTFEFTATGADRYKGSVVLFGRRIQSIQLAPHRFRH